LCFAAALSGCGVKGDPLPPEKPTELGRGRPNYRQAIKGIAIEKTAPEKNAPQEDPDDEEGDDE